jgi:hypothetical protein
MRHQRLRRLPARLASAALAAACLALPAEPARAALAEAFSADPRIDLAVQLSLRGGYLSPEHMLRDEPPPDRVGRERLDDAKADAARSYVRRVDDDLLREATVGLPGLADLERRYEALRTLGVFRVARPGAPADAGAGGDDVLTVRLRLDGGSHGARPGVEARYGEWRGRARYQTGRERLDLDLVRRLSETLEVSLVGSDAPGAPAEIGVALTLAF